MVQAELKRIQEEGLLVPSAEGVEPGGLVWEKGDIDIGRVQKFWPTAPAQGEPGGSSSESTRSWTWTALIKAAWYTNPQTEAFCGMLQIPNRINPAPIGV